MATLNAQQLSAYAQQAGFSGQALQNIVAIALAESGGNTDAYNGNDPSGGSYGVLQINGVHFGSGTSKSCALDPACAFRFAYSLSGGGTNLNPWSTFTSGLYRNFIGGLTLSQNWYDYTSLHNFRNTYSWATYPVNGVDIPMPQDTPITALFSGTVSKEYVDQSGGVEIIKVDDPNQLKGIPYYYYAHLDQFSVNQGTHVSPGQQIGLSGGQNSGGTYNASPNTSSGPHIMLGESKTNSIPYTLDTITSDLNPDWLLQYAQQNHITTSPCNCSEGLKPILTGTGWECQGFVDGKVKITKCDGSSTGGTTDPVTALNNFFASISTFTTWINDPVRIIKLLFGILLIGGAIFLIASPQGQIAQGIMKGARKVGVK